MLRKKFTEFHCHLTTVVSERDKALSIQNSLLTSQDQLKLKYRFLEVSTRSKVRLSPLPLIHLLPLLPPSPSAPLDFTVPVHCVAVPVGISVSSLLGFQSLHLMSRSLFIASSPPPSPPVHSITLTLSRATHSLPPVGRKEGNGKGTESNGSLN
jgi:hypothetical protein